jgi:hypothetical protein
MKRFAIFQWAAVLILTIAVAPSTASAQEADTLTISGLFSMDYLDGTVGPDLAEVYANGHEHTWTLTLHGTSHSHYLFSSMYYATEIHATSFDLEFFGPDAATLNSIVSDHIAGGDVNIYLENAYWPGGGFAVMHVWPSGPDMDFYSGHDMGVNTLFPTDEDGYPVVGPEQFSIESDYSELTDMRPGNNGAIQSRASLVTFEGSMGEPAPEDPVVLAVADASVLEGNRGTSRLDLTVTLSRSSNQVVAVNYVTANGTALAKSDYTATSGTLTVPPGQTQGTISVAIKGDRKRERNETFSVQLSGAVGATISDGVATATILNDD